MLKVGWLFTSTQIVSSHPILSRQIAEVATSHTWGVTGELIANKE